ncbi:MAG: pyridoxamine 5'-phosphate oxidase family protein [Rhodoblastus sp.]
MSRIETLEQLRAVLGDPREATKAKVLSHLDEQSADFIRASAFAILSTVSKDGVVEASPKGDEPGFVRIENETTLLMPERPGNNLAFRPVEHSRDRAHRPDLSQTAHGRDVARHRSRGNLRRRRPA